MYYKDFLQDFGYFFSIAHLIYILCSFAQIFAPIYVAKKLTATYGETRKILRINSMNVINKEIEQSVSVSSYKSTLSLLLRFNVILSIRISICVCVCVGGVRTNGKIYLNFIVFSCIIFNVFILQIEELSLEMLHNHMTISFHNLFTLDYALWYAVSN